MLPLAALVPCAASLHCVRWQRSAGRKRALHRGDHGSARGPSRTLKRMQHACRLTAHALAPVAGRGACWSNNTWKQRTQGMRTLQAAIAPVAASRGSGARVRAWLEVGRMLSSSSSSRHAGQLASESTRRSLKRPAHVLVEYVEFVAEYEADEPTVASQHLTAGETASAKVSQTVEACADFEAGSQSHRNSSKRDILHARWLCSVQD